MTADALLRVMGKISDAELASMITISLTEWAYREKCTVLSIVDKLEGFDPWETQIDACSGATKPRLTIAGQVWERLTGRRRYRGKRLN